MSDENALKYHILVQTLQILAIRRRIFNVNNTSPEDVEANDRFLIFLLFKSIFKFCNVIV